MEKYSTRFTNEEVHNIVLQVFTELRPRLTIRQIYYALTNRGVVPGTEAGYRQTCRALGVMRENGLIPHGWIADNLRRQIKPDTDPGLRVALDRWQETYHRDLWLNQPDYVEVWVERDSLAEVVSPITAEYGVPLYTYHGDSSTMFLYEMAEYFNSREKDVYIYYFGDFDPSRVDAVHEVRDGLIRHGANAHFTQVAVTPEQIERMNLPTKKRRPHSPSSDGSVELDAIPAPVLRDLVRKCIEKHLDKEAMKRTRRIESLEKKTLAEFSMNFVEQYSDLVTLC